MAPRRRRGARASTAAQRTKSLAECLQVCGLDPDAEPFAGCANLEDEFKRIKQGFFRTAKTAHPDKGGSAEAFRELRAAFQALKDLAAGGRIATFQPAAGRKKAPKKAPKKRKGRKKAKAEPEEEEEPEAPPFETSFNVHFDGFEDLPIPSWDAYEEAEGEEVPTYRMEYAATGRSMCVMRQPAAKSKLKRFACPTCDSEGNPLMQKEDGQGILRTVIEKGTVRVGSLDEMSGSYGRFVHATCWRVPQKVWEKLPDPPADEAIFLKAMLEMDAVIFTGFSELEIDDQRAIVEHMMDKANWTRHDADGKCNLKRKPEDAGAPALEGPAKKAKKAPKKGKAIAVVDLTAKVKSETKKKPAKKEKKAPKQGKAIAVVDLTATDSAAIEIASPKKERFVIPRPGVGNAVADALVLNGKPLTVVMTGLFPEIGGGAGLSLGKDKTKAMLASFGAKVTGSVSGKTDILLCGKEPGMLKVTKGRNSGKCTLMGLEGLCEGLRENKVPETIAYFKANPWQITSFSAGYFRGGEFNGLAGKASVAELEAAATGKAGPKAIKGA